MSDSSRSNTPSGWKRPANTGPRIGRLGDAPTAAPSSSSGGRRIATLNDLGSSGGGGGSASGGGFGGGASHGHAHDDDDDDDDGQDPQTFFAGGGERSGVSIQGPPGTGRVPGGDVVRDLLRRAAELRIAEDDEPPTAIRRITFWREGFSVDHDDTTGELRRYDNPENAQILREINEGRAPPSILNIQPGQPVELRIARRTHEDYVPPAGSASRLAFAGSGHRLGSPVPSAAPVPASAMPGDFPATAPASPAALSGSVPRETASTQFEVDTSLPTTRVQIRLADGSRLTARMNLTHRVRDLRGFVNASSPGASARAYTLNTAHPTMKSLEDEEKTIEQAGLANSVVVQRWV
ncbi:hypothetical protein PHLGIDRAFT_13399 [Phlebiopsis gigantea 11061_1 CR5-6]|uniref:UBX domain-containing protein n=1 Tax=Phlebiopsis gigantea (strain 11061_1 CR5-6) TaxID=745531 RepID=A0A0C3SAN5_PHLG1|nr:hypothetical protein PHLGIDRAFT_13399 [Phlebiopsis gigantea 11061_1 CR5-6]